MIATQDTTTNSTTDQSVVYPSVISCRLHKCVTRLIESCSFPIIFEDCYLVNQPFFGSDEAMLVSMAGTLNSQQELIDWLAVDYTKARVNVLLRNLERTQPSIAAIIRTVRTDRSIPADMYESKLRVFSKDFTTVETVDLLDTFISQQNGWMFKRIMDQLEAITVGIAEFNGKIPDLHTMYDRQLATYQQAILMENKRWINSHIPAICAIYDQTHNKVLIALKANESGSNLVFVSLDGRMEFEYSMSMLKNLIDSYGSFAYGYTLGRIKIANIFENKLILAEVDPQSLIDEARRKEQLQLNSELKEQMGRLENKLEWMSCRNNQD